MKLMTRLGQWMAALAVAGSLMQAQAARPLVVDDLPGVPAQPTAYWNQVRSEQSAAAAVAQAPQDETANTFFTGKPYDADLQGYLFQYRTYRADVARWTSADPSGFPDGANNTAYRSNPLSSVDYQGLVDVTLYSTITAISGPVTIGVVLHFDVAFSDPTHPTAEEVKLTGWDFANASAKTWEMSYSSVPGGVLETWQAKFDKILPPERTVHAQVGGAAPYVEVAVTGQYTLSKGGNSFAFNTSFGTHNFYGTPAKE